LPKDWLAWHQEYEEDSRLRRRLAVVQRRISEVLEAPGRQQFRIISMCAGDGRDLLGVLEAHPHNDPVRALLVELNPELAGAARARARDAGLDGIEIKIADAGTTSAYAAAVPADLVLVCGVFGNLTDEDIERTIAALPRLCAAGATVIWTRHRRPPDVTARIRSWFATAGFEELAYEPVAESTGTVGVQRLHASPKPFEPDVRMFEFVAEKQG